MQQSLNVYSVKNSLVRVGTAFALLSLGVGAQAATGAAHSAPSSTFQAALTGSSSGVTTAATSQPPAGVSPSTQNSIVQTLTAPKHILTGPSSLMAWLPDSAAVNFVAQARSTRSISLALSSVVASDVLLSIRPSTIRQKVGLQCQGVESDFRARTSVFVRDDSGTTRQRFGLAGTVSQPVMRYEVGAKDAVTVAPRCESYSMPTAENGFVSGEIIWNAANFWTDDWTGTTDEQIVMQWKNHGPAEPDQNPFFALILKGGRANITIRSNNDVPALRATNVVFVSPEFAWPAGQWNSVVVQSKISPSPTGGGFIRVWVNGAKVLDRNMAIGYRLGAGAYNYAKWGVYKWINGNPWDLRIPVRSVMFDRVVLIKDDEARYDFDTIRGYAFD